MTIDRPEAEQLGQLRQLWKEAFGDSDECIDSFFATAFSVERCRCVTAQNQVAAALYWFDCSCQGVRMAYLYAVATAAAFRNRGLCRRLVEDTHAHLRLLGYGGTILVPATAALEKMYAGMGYLPATGVREFASVAGAEPVAIHCVDPKEYACLRRAMLPPGGVVQEGECISYLQSQCRLYRGSDFLLAAQMEQGVLHAEELLGNAEAAPGILRALGAERGHFRAPGNRLFSMYYPLSTACPSPEYFGLSFG